VNFGVKIALITQLRLALIFTGDNNPSNDFIGCALMTSFTTSVNTMEARGLLTEAQATDLLQQAHAIQNAIGCNIGSLSETPIKAEADMTRSSTNSDLPFPSHSSLNPDSDEALYTTSLPY
jgi:hypothetical protein